MVYALSFVPERLVEHGFENLVKEYVEDQLEAGEFQDIADLIYNFLAYFEQTYIGIVGGRNRTRRRPIYPIAVWNKHQDVLDDLEITNNRCILGTFNIYKYFFVL